MSSELREETKDFEDLTVSWIKRFLGDRMLALSFYDLITFVDLVRLLDILYPYLCLEDSLNNDDILNQEKALQLFNSGLCQIGVADRFQLATSEIERGSSGPFKTTLIMLFYQLMLNVNPDKLAFPNDLKVIVTRSAERILSIAEDTPVFQDLIDRKPEVSGVKASDLQANFSDMDEPSVREEMNDSSLSTQINNNDKQNDRTKFFTLFLLRMLGKSLLEGKGDNETDEHSEEWLQDRESFFDALSRISMDTIFRDDDSYNILDSEPWKERDPKEKDSFYLDDDISDDDIFGSSSDYDLFSLLKSKGLFPDEDQEMADLCSMSDSGENSTDVSKNRETVDNLKTVLQHLKDQSQNPKMD